MPGRWAIAVLALLFATLPGCGLGVDEAEVPFTVTGTVIARGDGQFLLEVYDINVYRVRWRFDGPPFIGDQVVVVAHLEEFQEPFLDTDSVELPDGTVLIPDWPAGPKPDDPTELLARPAGG